MKTIKSVLIGALVALLGSSAWAESTLWNGYTIEYGNAAMSKLAGGDLLLQYKTTTGTSQLVIPEDTKVTARILVVGGGGAGGNPRGTDNTAGGGGGAGEMVDRSDVSLASGTYTITVGAGGTFSQNNVNAVGGSGGESSIRQGTDTIVSVKGGGGGGYSTTAGVQGGSGGGGGGQGSNSRVNAGGASKGATDGLASSGGRGHQYSAGGGGGAGGAGGDASRRSTAGNGGAASTSNITGENKAYAGGGGGGAGYYNSNLTPGSGGSANSTTVGAKGAARNAAAGTAAANTGSGGGGGTYANGTRQYPSAGAAGIVIVRLTNLVKLEYVDYGTNTLVIATGKTSDALDVTSEAAAQWKFWSENTSVATVSKATGATAASDSFTITAVDTEGKSTYCVASNKYAKYTFKVEGPKVEVNMGEIVMSHGECVTLTNKLGEAIAWTGAGEDTYTTENENVAKVVSSNGYACVTNMVHDGAVEVVLETATTKYTYLVRCMTVEIEKTIKAASVDKPSDKSNATIRVTTHVLYGVHGIPTNNILFITSTCSTHGLTEALLKGQIDTLATKGAVDYFFYAHANNATDAAKTDAAYADHLAMSNKLTKTIDVSSGKHYNLKAYLNCLNENLDLNHKNYDYIVLSFDSARLGNTYPKNNKDMEADVAAKLRWYYENDRVIWITDAAYDGSNKTGSNSYLDYETWEALCAIMDPITYCTKPEGSRYVSHSGNLYQGTKNTLQAVYTDKTATEKMLSDNVKMATYDTKLTDSVLNLNNSLSIVKTGSDTSEVHFYTWAGKSAPVAPDGGVIADLPKDSTHWAEEPDSAFKVDPVNYQVTANVSNITMETWNMFEISIVDNGTFLQECLAHDPPLAEFDEKTGMYTVNPNDGPANVTLYSVEGGKEFQVQSTAKATSVLWPLENPQMFIQLKDASRVYDGIATNVEFIAVTNASGAKVTTTKLEYSTSETGSWKPWSTAAFTDVTTAPQKVYVRAEATGYVPATNFAFVTITKAKIQTPKPGEEPTDKTKPYTQAPNIKYTYDGTSTNIVPDTKNLFAGNEPSYLFCLAGDDGKPGDTWVEWKNLQIKDVKMDGEDVTSNKVFYTVTTDKSGAENYFAATNFAWVLIEPCKITLTAFTYNWPYDGQMHETNKYSMTGSFVSGEGISSVEMDPVNSRITDVGETNNVIVTVNPQEGTKLDNYDIKLVPGKLYVSRVDLTPSQVWAEDAIKVYDGDNNTNIVIRWGDGMDPSKFTVTFAADSANKPDEQRQSGFALPKPSEAPADSEFDESFPGYHDSWTNKVWFRVTEKENYSEGDEKGNYSNYYGYAWVKIAPRPVHFSFPKAVKPYDGTTTGVPLATNLTVATHGAAQQGEDHGMIQPEKFVCTATGSFTGSNVKDAADYFQLESVTIKGERNAFKRNYVITYDGEADQLVPGEITAVPITPKKPGGTGDNPGEDPADDPTCTEPTIWARNIVKCYDGIGTNVSAQVYNSKGINTFTYEYSTNEIDFVDWDELQFTNVVSAQKVWYRAMNDAGNYLGVTNYAYVTITQRVVSAENGVIADSTNKVYGAAAPDLANHTWTGPVKGELVEGDTIASVGFAWTNASVVATLPVDTYEGMISTNGPNAIVIKNAAGEDVTANYVMGFTPGALTVTQKVLTVTLYDTNKVYGATTPDWTVKNVDGLVPGDSLTGVPGSIVGTEPTDASDTPYQVTVGLGTLDAGGNYTIVVKKPTLTITPAPIEPEDDVVLPGSSNTTENVEGYMKGVTGVKLVAFRTEVWTNDVPEVTTVGTNIVVRFKGLTDADTAAATFEWSTTGETGPWSSTEPNFTEICAEQVWCKVTCPNYVATNVTAYVYIKARDSKADDEKAEKEDKLQPNPDPTKPTTEEQAEKVVEDIAANDNRLPEGTGPGEYDPSKPAWDGTGELRGDGKPIPQTDAKVNLKVTSIVNLPTQAEKDAAEEHRTNEVAIAEKEAGVAPGTLEGRNIDVKLLYTRTYADGTKSDPIDIGGNNTQIIPFTIAVDLAEGEEIIKIVRYHGESKDEIKAGTDPAVEHFELSADRKYVTVYAKTYSEFIIIWGLIVPKPVYENSALLPLPYEFKASVKHLYLKEVKVKANGFNGSVYQKYAKASSLKGYMVIDRWGATSQTIVTGDTRNYNNVPGTGLDYGASRAFVIVKNSNVESSVRKPKVLPAVIDAKYFDTSFKATGRATSGLAEGYLFIGGDSIACVRPQLDEIGGMMIAESPAAPQPPSAGTPGMAAYADYLWTSVYLFGMHNGPNWYYNAGTARGPFDAFETAWDANLPAGLQTGFVSGRPFFHDTWMNGSGVGRYFIPNATTDGDLCCGLRPTTTTYEPILSSLAGSLKGGLFLCSENGIVAADRTYVMFNGGEWEDQFVTLRLLPAGSFAPDNWQNDLWQDGAVENETTDVLYGTWSIKYCKSFFKSVYKAVEPEEMEALVKGAPNAKTGTVVNHVESAAGLYNLVGAIKGSVLKLDKTAKFIEMKKADKEIHTMTESTRLDVPAITPKFAQYFGLANWW